MKCWTSMCRWLSRVREELNKILDRYAVGGCRVREKLNETGPVCCRWLSGISEALNGIL